MNKAELIQRLADVHGAIPKVVIAAIVNSTFEAITEHMKAGGEIQIVGFGTFATRLRKARAGVDPRSPERMISIQAVRVPKFKAGSNLKKAIKDGMT